MDVAGLVSRLSCLGRAGKQRARVFLGEEWWEMGVGEVGSSSCSCLRQSQLLLARTRGALWVTPHKSKLGCALPGFSTGNQGACGPEGHCSRSPAGGVASLLGPAGLSLLASWACVHVCAGRRSSGVSVDRAAAWYTNGEGLSRETGEKPTCTRI